MASSSSTSRHRIPSARSDVGKLCRAIDRYPSQQVTLTVLREALGWSQEKFDRTKAKALADPAARVAMVRGGRSMKSRRSEQRGGSDGNGLYSDVSRVIEKYWGPRRHCREIVMHATSRPKQRLGHQWVCPDVVMECHPGRKARPDVAKLVHTFEVEVATGFGIESVYQAHAQGRGADFSWVLFQRGVDLESRDHPDWDRILWAAKELGIGLVGFTKSSSVGTWKVEREAKRRSHTKAERLGFLETVLVQTFR